MIPGAPNPLLWGGDPCEMYKIKNSLMLDSGAGQFLSRIFTANGDRTKWTFSVWLKRGKLGTEQHIFEENAGTANQFYFNTSDQLFYQDNATAYCTTSRVFRDPTAMLHLVVVWDTTNTTAADRLRLYINGIRVTAFTSATSPTLNQTSSINSVTADGTHVFGRYNSALSSYLDGCFSEFHFIDGQALDASAFGFVCPSTGQWRPKKYTGFYGNNGCYLDFSNPASLGADSSGNNNHWTLNGGITSSNQLTDTPTNNYLVLNAASGTTGAYNTLTRGNLTLSNSTSSGTSGTAVSTFGVSSGKWYFEVTATGVPTAISNPGVYVGISNIADPNFGAPGGNGPASITGYAYRSYNGNKVSSGGDVAYGATYTVNDVIGVALDLNAGTLTFYKNNVSQGIAFTGLTGSFAALGSAFQGGTLNFNFGQKPFIYTPPAGHNSICTANLATSVIPAIKKPTYAFVIATDTGANIQATLASLMTGWGADGWIKIYKRRDAAEGWRWQFSDDAANYLDCSSTAAKAAFPALTAGGAYVGYALRLQPSNGIASGRLSHINGVADTVTDGLADSRKMVILKNEAVGSWYVFHPDLTAGKLLYLEQTAAETIDATISSVAASSFIAAAALPTGTYRWISIAEIAGLTKFFKYAANGVADGPFSATQGRPGFAMLKRMDGAEQFSIIDSVRDSYNPTVATLSPNLNLGEGSFASTNNFDLDSDGIKVHHAGASGYANTSGFNYVGFVINDFPLRYANAR